VNSLSHFSFKQGTLPGVNWSDHSSFWSKGYRALMVTDTAPYRYPYYHTAQDTPDRVNYEALASVTEGLALFFHRSFCSNRGIFIGIIKIESTIPS